MNLSPLVVHLAQELSWCRVGFTAYPAVGGLLASYLTQLKFPIKFTESFIAGIDCQALHSEMGTSPLSPDSVGSSQTLTNQLVDTRLRPPQMTNCDELS